MKTRFLVLLRAVLASAPLFSAVSHAAGVDFVSGANVKGTSAGGSLLLSAEPALERYFVGQKVKLRIDIELSGDGEPVQMTISGMPESGIVSISEFKPVVKSTPDGIYSFSAEMELLSEGTVRFDLGLECRVVVQERRGFWVMNNTRRLKLTDVSREMRIEDVPLEGRPEDFSGLVGNFELAASVSPRKASPGDILSFAWEVRGIGSFDGFKPQEYFPGDGFKVYPPKRESLSSDAVSFSQSLVPGRIGLTEAEKFELSVFDPVSGEFKRLTAGPFALEIVEREESDPGKIVVETSVSDKADRGERLAPAVRSPWGVVSALFGLGREAGMRAVCDTQTAAYLCPSYEAKKIFELPGGAEVEIREKSEGWVRVGFQGSSGWVPARVLRQVD